MSSSVPGMALARMHGAFNVASGVWPLLHRASFEAALGPKVDYWLVNTVAGLMITNGAVQLSAPSSRDGVTAARRIGVGTAAVLAVIDLVYVPKGRIRATYLVDAALELLWIGAWARHSSSDRRRPTTPVSPA